MAESPDPIGSRPLLPSQLRPRREPVDPNQNRDRQPADCQTNTQPPSLGLRDHASCRCHLAGASCAGPTAGVEISDCKHTCFSIETLDFKTSGTGFYPFGSIVCSVGSPYDVQL